MNEPFVPTCEQVEEIYSTFKNVEYQPNLLAFKIWWYLKEFATVHSAEELLFTNLSMQEVRDFAVERYYGSHIVFSGP